MMTLTSNVTLLYISVGLYGASLSNCFATGFLYAQSFLKVSQKLASKFIFGGSIGSALIPASAGVVLEGIDFNLLGTIGPSWANFENFKLNEYALVPSFLYLDFGQTVLRAKLNVEKGRTTGLPRGRNSGPSKHSVEEEEGSS